MSKRQDKNLPESLSKARLRFEQWREQSRPRSRIPEDLWTIAAELAREHGVNRTAKALRLDYYALKKKLDAVADPERSASDFIEVFPNGIPSSLNECTIEVEDGIGAKMRIHFKGTGLPDLAAITRVFRGEEQ